MDYGNADDIVLRYGIPYTPQTAHQRYARGRLRQSVASASPHRSSSSTADAALEAASRALASARDAQSESRLAAGQPAALPSVHSASHAGALRLETLREQRRLAELRQQEAEQASKERELARAHELALAETAARVEREARANESEQQQIERLFREQRLLVEAQTAKMTLEAKVADKIEKLECIVCLQAVATHAFSLCGHLCVCDDCVKEMAGEKPGALYHGGNTVEGYPALAAEQLSCPICTIGDQKVLQIRLA